MLLSSHQSLLTLYLTPELRKRCPTHQQCWKHGVGWEQGQWPGRMCGEGGGGGVGTVYYKPFQSMFCVSK